MHVNNAGITRQYVENNKVQKTNKKKTKHELKVQLYGKLISFYN